MPVDRFLTDFVFPHDSIAEKDRLYLILMERFRIVGNTFNTLQDRDLHALKLLLRHIKYTITKLRSLISSIAIGFNRDVIRRVRVNRPKTLQYAISCAKGVESKDTIETGYFALGCARVLNTTGENCHIYNQLGHFARECKSKGKHLE